MKLPGIARHFHGEDPFFDLVLLVLVVVALALYLATFQELWSSP